MSITSRIVHFVGGLFFERPVRGVTAEALFARFTASHAPYIAALEGKADTAKNRALVAHIIGVERWAQARINQVRTGVTYHEECDRYVPATDTSYADLVRTAATTRTESIALVQSLITADIALTQIVTHNEFGALSLAAWIQYMMSHSMLEAKKLR
jgi:hypothetical protein